MAFIPVPDAVHAQLLYQTDGQLAINDLYFNAGGTPNAADMGTLGSSLLSWFTANLAPLLSSSTSLESIRLTDLGSQFGTQVVEPAGVPGEDTGEQAPNNVAPCVSFRTQFRGRSFRGRNYIVGVPNSQIATNTLNSDWMTSIRDAYAILLPGGGFAYPGLYEWVVVSRFTGGGPRTTGVFTPVQTVTFTDNIVDSQRRRLPGRGA